MRQRWKRQDAATWVRKTATKIEKIMDTSIRTAIFFLNS
jgi:hypothetical protein